MGSGNREDVKLSMEKKQCCRGKHGDCSIEVGWGLRQHHPRERPGTEKGNNQSWKDDEKRLIANPHGPIAEDQSECRGGQDALLHPEPLFYRLVGYLEPWEKEGNP